MKLIKQSGPDCLVTSAAMCLNVEPAYIWEYLGTDGHEIWWPPSGMRGLHIQEIIDIALTLGKPFYPIEYNPMIAPSLDVEPKEIFQSDKKERFLSHVRAGVSILILHGHACACDGTHVYDPRGYIFDLENLDGQIIEAWIMI